MRLIITAVVILILCLIPFTALSSDEITLTNFTVHFIYGTSAKKLMDDCQCVVMYNLTTKEVVILQPDVILSDRKEG